MSLAFDAGATALLLIDVQNFVLDERQHPPRPAFYDRARDVVLPTLRGLLPTARASGVEVVYTVMENLTHDGRDRSLDYKLSGFFIAKGSWEAQVAPEVAQGDDEMVLSKTSACLFNSTNFEYLMRNIGIGTILCTGFLTDQCVEQTAKAGASLGFHMVVVEDACAANDNARHEAALARLDGFAEVAPADAILRGLRR